jgi:hypothetical protein
VGHAYVGQHHVDAFAFQHLEGLISARGFERVVAQAAQEPGKRAGQQRLVIDQEDAQGQLAGR